VKVSDLRLLHGRGRAARSGHGRGPGSRRAPGPPCGGQRQTPNVVGGRRPFRPSPNSSGRAGAGPGGAGPGGLVQVHRPIRVVVGPDLGANPGRNRHHGPEGTSGPAAALARIEWSDMVDSTDGPLELAKIVCARRHWFLMPTECLCRPDGASRLGQPEPTGKLRGSALQSPPAPTPETRTPGRTSPGSPRRVRVASCTSRDYSARCQRRARNARLRSLTAREALGSG
jgi:hypothetical protein